MVRTKQESSAQILDSKVLLTEWQCLKGFTVLSRY